MSSPGIFVIEGDWYGDDTTMAPLVDLLRQGLNRKVNVQHRRVETREALAQNLRCWRRTSRFPLLLLAMHGRPGVLFVDQSRRRRDAVELTALADMIGEGCGGRVVHFSACSTFAVRRRCMVDFLRRTGMVAATGFATDVSWLRSAAFELLVLAEILRRRVTLRNARRMADVLRTETPSLRRELGFRCITR